MKQTSVKKNFIMNALLTMSSFIFPLITFPYVSTILSPSGYGSVTFATSVITYFSMFAQLGIPTYGIRACAQVRDDKEKLSRTTQELFIINLMMSILAYIVFFICLFKVPRLAEEKPLFLIISLLIMFNCIGMEWLYKGLEQYTYITIRSVLFKFIALLAMFALIHAKSDYVIYGAISIFASSASSLLNFIYARKFIIVKPMGHYNFKRHLRPIGIFFAMSCATTVYTNLDTVMLGFMKTNTDVGYYQAAVKIKTVLVSIVTSLGTVLLPRASYYIEHNEKEQFENITKKALNFVILISIPLAVYFTLFASDGIYFLSSQDYTGAIRPMQIIMPTLIFIGLTNILGMQILVPTGNEICVLYSEVAGGIVDFIINLILIPSMASSGAAIGTLVAEFVVLIVQLHYTKDFVADIFKSFNYFRILISLAVSIFISSFFKDLQILSSLRWNSFLVIVITGIIFFGIYGLLLLFMKEPFVIEIKNDLLRRFKGEKHEKV
ncbi:MAG: flippase [Catenisphaera adipataccumulans]|jgi:O-antigen/teichoic acid export membrane protein|uniref:flippase n=1 Tax=Catenisphaera adipataccumulans TaxID=700500 RepID=UPI003D8E6144